MLTFEQFYKEFLAEAAYLPHQLRNMQRYYRAHTVTHGERKQRVVQSEGDFFRNAHRQLTGAINFNRGNTKMLGVVGAGEGLQNHINQAINLGFHEKDIMFFEIEPSHFQELADAYARYVYQANDINAIYDAPGLREKGIEMQWGKKSRDREHVYSFYPKNPPSNYEEWAAQLDRLRQNNTDLRTVKSQNGNIIANEPYLVNARLPIDGGELHNILNDVLPNNLATQRGFVADNISHIDFDITTTPNNMETAIDTVRDFFETYPALQSLVIVYSWQRSLPAQENETAAWNTFQTKYDNLFNFIFTNNMLNYTDSRLEDMKAALKIMSRKGQRHGMGHIQDLQNEINAIGHTAFFQLYYGTTTAMLSIACVRGNHQEINPQPIIDDLSTKFIEDFNALKNAVNKYIINKANDRNIAAAHNALNELNAIENAFFE